MEKKILDFSKKYPLIYWVNLVNKKQMSPPPDTAHGFDPTHLCHTTQRNYFIPKPL